MSDLVPTSASARKPPVPITVIVACLNEQAMLADCLESVRFAAEIMVVDSFSTDQTLELARRYTNRILQHPFWSHGAQINWATPQAAHDWILVVDADERVTPALAEEICVLLRQPEFAGYWISRRNIFLGREIRHGSWAKDSVIRLFRRDRARYEERRVHSSVVVNGKTGNCREHLLHYSYRSLEDCARKVQRFSIAGALDAHAAGGRSGPLKMLTRSVSRFVKSYFLRLGFLDGTEGLIIASMEAQLAFNKYAKLWELNRNGTARTGPILAGVEKDVSNTAGREQTRITSEQSE